MFVVEGKSWEMTECVFEVSSGRHVLRTAD
jgi:hypothetical protein